MNIKAQDLLDELQKLDIDIKSRMDEINELKPGYFQAPNFRRIKFQG